MASIFEKEPTNQDFYSPVGDEIALVAGYPNVPGSKLEDDLCSQLKKCGFNSLAANIGAGGIAESLTYCNKYGLKLFLSNATLRQCNNGTNTHVDNCVNMVNAYKNNNGLGGWLLAPIISDAQIMNPDQVTQVPGDPNYCAYYKVYDLISNADPQHPIILGINADWERDVNFAKLTESFPTIIAKYQEYFKPGLWVWSYFPWLTGGEISTAKRWATYYKNLQYFSYVSYYTGIPFWTFCLCQAFNSYYGYNAPVPTVSLIRQAVFSALAYGAQGIYYWNIRQSSNGGGTTYSFAPIDNNGTKTNIWYYLQQVNKEVKLFNKVFYNCRLVDCRFKSDNTNYSELKKMIHPMGPLTEVSGSSLNLLISHINKEGKDYLVLVSASPSNVVQTIKLTFNNYWTVSRISIVNSQIETQKVDSDYSVTLSQGDYLIFSWI